MPHSLGLTWGGTTVDADPEDINPSILPPAVLAAVEADSFWCLSRLLDGIQDNYITAQPGIQRSVKRMAELVARIDTPLSEHLAAQGVEFMQFAFRWMNCLLMREISVKNTVRMWDTYLVRLRLPCFDVVKNSSGILMTGCYMIVGRPGRLFSIPLICLFGISRPVERQAPCDGFPGSLEIFMSVSRPQILNFYPQGIIMFLQSLPTQDWTDHEIEMLLSQAFVLNSIWHNAQSHFTAK